MVADSILQELKDQRSYLKLIASENYSSLAVQLAMGNLLTDKYAEGFAGHRFYAGCDNIDTIESEAVSLAKKVFNADHAYVQPHSGADANLIAFWSILVKKIEDKEIERLNKKSLFELTEDDYQKIRDRLVSQKILGLSLNSGGHLTHGYRLNISSKMMRAFSYDIDPSTHKINYSQLHKQAQEIKPLILIAGYSAYPGLIDFAKMKEIADSVNAVLMVDMAHFAGLVAGGVFTGNYNPVPFADIITSTTHKTLRGPRGGMILCSDEFKDVVDKGCPIVQGGPLPHVMAAKAIAFKEIDTPEFCAYAKQVVKNSKALAQSLIKQDVRLITNGTENHLILFDVDRSFSLTGRQAENALREAGITVNRNAILNDKNGPWYTSGIRIGASAVTTLKMKEGEMEIIADCIVKILKNTKPGINKKTNKPSKAKAVIDQKILMHVKEKISNLKKKFPLYPEIIID